MMKKMAILFCFALAAYTAKAQEHSVKDGVEKGVKSAAHGTEKAAKSAAHGTEKAAKTVGHKTAEIASKGASKIADETYKDKVGPRGQTIYIDGHSRYYWVNSKGHKVYVNKSQLKDKY